MSIVEPWLRRCATRMDSVSNRTSSPHVAILPSAFHACAGLKFGTSWAHAECTTFRLLLDYQEWIDVGLSRAPVVVCLIHATVNTEFARRYIFDPFLYSLPTSMTYRTTRNHTQRHQPWPTQQPSTSAPARCAIGKPPIAVHVVCATCLQMEHGRYVIVRHD